MNPLNWSVVVPEIVLLVMACVVAVVDLYVEDPRRRVTYWLTQLTLVAVAALHLVLLDSNVPYGMQDMVVSDPMGHLLSSSTRCSAATTTSVSCVSQ